MAIYDGGCHCGRIGFAVEGEIDKLYECNCSICSKRGALHWFVAESQFRLNSPEENGSAYSFNKHAIRYRFCETCGIMPYAKGEKPGAGPMVCVNARCLDGFDPKSVEIVQIDGRSF